MPIVHHKQQDASVFLRSVKKQTGGQDKHFLHSSDNWHSLFLSFCTSVHWAKRRNNTIHVCMSCFCRNRHLTCNKSSFLEPIFLIIRLLRPSSFLSFWVENWKFLHKYLSQYWVSYKRVSYKKECIRTAERELEDSWCQFLRITQEISSFWLIMYSTMEETFSTC